MQKRKLNIRSVIKHACKCCDCPELLEKGKIRVEFTDGFSSSLADAEWFKKEGYGLIRLNRAEWDLMEKEQQAELLIHETVHLVQDAKYGRFKDNQKDHGERFRILMKSCGIENPRSYVEV